MRAHPQSRARLRHKWRNVIRRAYCREVESGRILNPCDSIARVFFRVSSPSLIRISSRSDRLTRPCPVRDRFRCGEPLITRKFEDLIWLALIMWRRVAVGLARVTALWRGKICGPYLARVYHTSASTAQFRSFLAFTFLRDVKRGNRLVSWLVKSGPLSRASKSQTSPLRTLLPAVRW